MDDQFDSPSPDDDDDPYDPVFDPTCNDWLADYRAASLKARHDGWTAQRQYDFLTALAESGCVADACRSVGMSETSAYRLRRHADAVHFRRAWDAALDYAVHRIADAALSRALHGTVRPVFYKGEQVGERRYFDERLAMFILRYRDPARYGKWLDHRDFTEPADSLARLAELLAGWAHEDALADEAGLPRRLRPSLGQWRDGDAPVDPDKR